MCNSYLECDIWRVNCCVTGCQSRKIAISERLFTDGFVMFKGLTQYRAGVQVTTQSGEQGMSFLDFELNTPPVSGSCIVSPLTGVTIQTLFTVSCANWNDDDGILMYQFFSKTFSVMSLANSIFVTRPMSNVVLLLRAKFRVIRTINR